MNIEVNNGRSVRKMVELGSENKDYRLVRQRAKEFTSSEVELSMLEDYYRLLVNTTYLREEAYEFIVNGKTYKQIIKELEVNEGYMRNIVYKETRRIFAEIGTDPLADVLMGGVSKEEVERTHSKIIELSKKENSKNEKWVADLFSFDIESKSIIDRGFNRKIEDSDFQELADVLKYFVKPYQEMLLEEIDERYLGYIFYLLRADDKSLLEEDLERKKSLQLGWLLK